MLAAAVLTAVATLAAAAALEGEAAPDFALKSTTGENLRLSEYRGEVVVLSFWATWCGDCRAQVPALSEVYARYREAGVALLAVSLDKSMHQAGEGARDLDMPYPVLHDAGGDVGRLFEVDSMPVVVLIDRAGVVREVMHGFKRGQTQYLDRVQALLRE